MRAVLPVAKQNATSAGTSPSEDEQRDHAQDAERLNARAGRGVGAEDDALQFAELFARVRRVNSAARSLPLCTSSRPRLQPFAQATI